MPEPVAQKPKIVIVGGLNMDLVVRVPVIPKPGETIQGYTFATFPGGKGANQAVAASRLGGRVHMVGRTGSDAFGLQLLDSLRREGVDTGQVKADPQHATGVALITVEDSGQNNISVASGANMQVTPEQVRAGLQAIGPFDWLMMPIEVPMETILAAAETARRMGARVLLNPSPARVLPEELLHQVDMLTPNEFEAAILTGIDIHDEAGARQAALQLQSGLQDQAQVLITLGARGALALDAEKRFTLLSPYPVKVLDTTAAGDAFVGGLVVALGAGRPLVEAGRFACAAGALTVTRAGAQPSLPMRHEVETLMRNQTP